MKTLYLQAINSVVNPSFSDKELRQQLKSQGVDARRLSRFTQLALLGALPLKNALCPQTSLFLGSPFNSPARFDKMFSQLNEDDFPSPLDFMANISNAATFHVAQALEINNTSLFLAIDAHCFWQPLWLAINELIAANTQTALVGWVLESADAKQPDGVVWWQLSTHPNDTIAEIRLEKKTNSPEKEAIHDDFFQPLIGVENALEKGKDLWLSGCGLHHMSLQITPR